MERALRLLRPGGRLAVLVPDSVLAAASYRYFREWLLQHVAVHMIISLPVETFRPVGHSGKASLLLLEKLPGRSSNQVVLVADVRSIGYDRSEDSIATNDLPTLLEVIRTYRDEGIVAEKLAQPTLRVWQVHSHELSADRFDISHLDRAAPDPIMLIQRAQYPFAVLGDLVELTSGIDCKNYADGETDTALMVQAGAVRDLELVLTDARRIPLEDYRKYRRAQLKPGDVLVTIKGQYLGRAAMVPAGIGSAVASTAVAILTVRPNVELDPLYLAAFISSSIGKEQIERRRQLPQRSLTFLAAILQEKYHSLATTSTSERTHATHS